MGDEPGAPVELDPSAVRVHGSSEVIGQVADLTVLPDGSVWVLDVSEPFFVGFGPDGTALGPYGAAGGGPRELRGPAAFVTGNPGGEAWVFDRIRHALIRVAGPDAPWQDGLLPRDSLPPGSVIGGMDFFGLGARTAALGNEVVFPRTSRDGDPDVVALRMRLLRPDLVAVDLGTGAARTIVSLGRVMDDPAEGFEDTEGGFPLWYRLWAVCGGERIVVHDRTTNALRTFGPDGAEGAPVELPPPPFTEVSPRQFAGTIYRLRAAEVAGAVGPRLTVEDSLRVIDEVLARVQGQPHQLAAYLPRYVDLRCGDAGAVWLRPLDPDVGGLEGSATWLRVATDGAARRVRFPDGFEPLRFQDGRAWGVQRDELDVPSVAWISLPAAR